MSCSGNGSRTVERGLLPDQIKSGLAVPHALIECSENTNAHFMFGIVGPAVPGGVQRTSPTEPSLRSGRFELKCDRIEGQVRRLG